MKTYKELQAEIRELQAKAEKQRQAEIQKAVDEIKDKMREYGITIDDLAPTKRARKNVSSGVVAPKYRNPETGETWTGRGKPPRWIAGKDRDPFLIK